MLLATQEMCQWPSRCFYFDLDLSVRAVWIVFVSGVVERLRSTYEVDVAKIRVRGFEAFAKDCAVPICGCNNLSKDLRGPFSTACRLFCC